MDYETFSYVCLMTGKIELSTAKYDKSQGPVNSTDSINYYSTVGNQQHCTKQISISNAVYKLSTKSSCFIWQILFM